MLIAAAGPAAAANAAIGPPLPPHPPPFAGPGVAFAAIFSDHAVLQRAPEAASVYGVVVGEPKATGVTVAVTPSGGGGSSYTVTATHLTR